MKISDSMLNFGQGKEIFVRFSSFNGFYTILGHKKDRKIGLFHHHTLMQQVQILLFQQAQ